MALDSGAARQPFKYRRTGEPDEKRARMVHAADGYRAPSWMAPSGFPSGVPSFPIAPGIGADFLNPRLFNHRQTFDSGLPVGRLNDSTYPRAPQGARGIPSAGGAATQRFTSKRIPTEMAHSRVALLVNMDQTHPMERKLRAARRMLVWSVPAGDAVAATREGTVSLNSLPLLMWNSNLRPVDGSEPAKHEAAGSLSRFLRIARFSGGVLETGLPEAVDRDLVVSADTPAAAMLDDVTVGTGGCIEIANVFNHLPLAALGGTHLWLLFWEGQVVSGDGNAPKPFLCVMPWCSTSQTLDVLAVDKKIRALSSGALESVRVSPHRASPYAHYLGRSISIEQHPDSGPGVIKTEEQMLQLLNPRVDPRMSPVTFAALRSLPSLRIDLSENKKMYARQIPSKRQMGRSYHLIADEWKRHEAAEKERADQERKQRDAEVKRVADANVSHDRSAAAAANDAMAAAALSPGVPDRLNGSGGAPGGGAPGVGGNADVGRGGGGAAAAGGDGAGPGAGPSRVGAGPPRVGSADTKHAASASSGGGGDVSNVPPASRNTGVSGARSRHSSSSSASSSSSRRPPHSTHRPPEND